MSINKFIRDLHDKRCTFSMTQEEVKDLELIVNHVVRDYLPQVIQQLPVNQNMIKIKDILDAGSYFEGTKIKNPNEFDFMVVVEQLSGDGIVLSKGCKPGYVRVGTSNQELWGYTDENQTEERSFQIAMLQFNMYIRYALELCTKLPPFRGKYGELHFKNIVSRGSPYKVFSYVNTASFTWRRYLKTREISKSCSNDYEIPLDSSTCGSAETEHVYSSKDNPGLNTGSGRITNFDNLSDVSDISENSCESITAHAYGTAHNDRNIIAGDMDEGTYDSLRSVGSDTYLNNLGFDLQVNTPGVNCKQEVDTSGSDDSDSDYSGDTFFNILLTEMDPNDIPVGELNTTGTVNQEFESAAILFDGSEFNLDIDLMTCCHQSFPSISKSLLISTQEPQLQLLKGNGCHIVLKPCGNETCEMNGTECRLVSYTASEQVTMRNISLMWKTVYRVLKYMFGFSEILGIDSYKLKTAVLHLNAKGSSQTVSEAFLEVLRFLLKSCYSNKMMCFFNSSLNVWNIDAYYRLLVKWELLLFIRIFEIIDHIPENEYNFEDLNGIVNAWIYSFCEGSHVSQILNFQKELFWTEFDMLCRQGNLFVEIMEVMHRTIFKCERFRGLRRSIKFNILKDVGKYFGWRLFTSVLKELLTVINHLP